MERADAAHTQLAPALIGSPAITQHAPAPVRLVRPRTSAATAPSVVALLKALRRRWVLAVCCGLALAAVAAVAARQVLPAGKHTARAQLYVSATAPRVMFDTKDPKAEFNNYLKSQMAMLKSRPLLKLALASPQMANLAILRGVENPIEWLEKLLQVDTGVSPEIMRVYLTGDRPDELITVVSAVTETYLQEVVNKEQKDRLDRLHQLEQSCKKYEDIIQENKQKRKSLAERTGSGDPQALAIRERLLAERLAVPERELLGVQSEIRKMEIDIANLKAQAAAGDPVVLESDIELEIDKDRVMVELAAVVAQAEAKFERARSVIARDPSDPIFNRYRSEIDTARNALTERRKSIRSSVLPALKERLKLETKALAETAQKRLATLREQEKSLNNEVNRVAGELKELNQSATALEGFKEAIVEAEEMSKQLTLEKERRNVEIQAPPRVSLWEEAAVTQADNERRRMMAAGLAGLGSLAFVLFGFAWWEFHARRVYGPEDVVHGLGMRVMGVLPKCGERNNIVRPSTASGDPGTQGPFIECVDSIRTMVAHAAHVDGLRVLMVTSAVQGEGKTMLASHLAARFAATGMRTLLVDGDLRSPAAHNLFNLPPTPGLAEVLRGDVPPTSVVHSIPRSPLDVMPAGTCDSLASQALAQGRFYAVIEELKDRYEMIVIDSSPVLPVSDALMIGQQVDGVVFSVLRDVSRIPKVNAGVQRLEALGIPVLGAVVSGDSESNEAAYP
jgi:capsular exopolysaccharide synthesis family protein